MIAPYQEWLALIGRILISALFLMGGIGKIGGMAGTIAYAQAAGLPLPQIAVPLGMAIEIGGPVLMILGFRTRLAATTTLLFTLTAAYFFHHYWTMTGAAAAANRIQFWKNIAISGGLLYLVAYGAGRISVDGRRKA